MRILEWQEFLDKGIPGCDSSAITVGVFDGVHRGHRALIERIVQYGRGALPVIVTFRQNHKNRNPAYQGDISSFRQRMALFEKLGVELTVAADLSGSFRHMSGEDFLGLLREHGKMRFLAVGSNFRCGYHLDTDAELIRELNGAKGIPTDIVESLMEKGLPISSSRIRAAVSRGELDEATLMLGRRFTFDLEGAEKTGQKDAEAALIVDALALGRVLPPPGSYRVLLRRGDSPVPGEAIPAEITAEQGRLTVPAIPGCEYIEF